MIFGYLADFVNTDGASIVCGAMRSDLHHVCKWTRSDQVAHRTLKPSIKLREPAQAKFVGSCGHPNDFGPMNASLPSNISLANPSGPRIFAAATVESHSPVDSTNASTCSPSFLNDLRLDHTRRDINPVKKTLGWYL